MHANVCRISDDSTFPRPDLIRYTPVCSRYRRLKSFCLYTNSVEHTQKASEVSCVTFMIRPGSLILERRLAE